MVIYITYPVNASNNKECILCELQHSAKIYIGTFSFIDQTVHCLLPALESFVSKTPCSLIQNNFRRDLLAQPFPLEHGTFSNEQPVVLLSNFTLSSRRRP